LGVQKTATPEEIKKAFRTKARTMHPDAGGSEEDFKKVNEAYEVLSDVKKRKEYDQFGRFVAGEPGQGRTGQYGNGPTGNWPAGGNTVSWNDTGDTGGFGGFSDIFDRIARGEGAFGTEWDIPKQPVRGRDLKAVLKVSFAEAMTGTTRVVRVRVPATGEVQKLTVKVPAGAMDGGKLRYRGKGDVGRDGGSRGDLVIVTEVEKDPIFSRSGADVLVDLSITYPEAVLGSTISVPTPDGGSVRLKVPAGSHDGAVLRMSGKGAPKVKGEGNGALKVKLHVAVPEKLTDEQKGLIEKLLATMDPHEVRPEIEEAVHRVAREE
jgi:curved DNA-binding protein